MPKITESNPEKAKGYINEILGNLPKEVGSTSMEDGIVKVEYEAPDVEEVESDIKSSELLDLSQIKSLLQLGVSGIEVIEKGLDFESSNLREQDPSEWGAKEKVVEKIDLHELFAVENIKQNLLEILNKELEQVFESSEIKVNIDQKVIKIILSSNSHLATGKKDKLKEKIRNKIMKKEIEIDDFVIEIINEYK